MSIAMDIPQEFQFSCSSDFIFLHAASVKNQSIRYSDIALYSQKLLNWLEAHQSAGAVSIDSAWRLPSVLLQISSALEQGIFVAAVLLLGPAVHGLCLQPMFKAS